MHPDDWKPAATERAAFLRADVNRRIRDFFYQRNVLEVETPVLSQFGVTDLHLDNLKSRLAGDGLPSNQYFLQTSPEYAMKRLLAAGFGSVYQLSKVFRDEEISRRHNPEFTMLEWYRPEWTDRELMAEVSELLTDLLGISDVAFVTYQKAFISALGLDPLEPEGIEQLRDFLASEGFAELARDEDSDTLLQLAMSYYVEPTLNPDHLVFVTNFPASQAALAKLDTANPGTARRFEVFCKGLELANGFQELTNPVEQKKRFETDNQLRETSGRKPQPVDYRLLQALEADMPEAAGVAIGIDRVLMIKLGTKDIRDVILFPVDKA